MPRRGKKQQHNARTRQRARSGEKRLSLGSGIAQTLLTVLIRITLWLWLDNHHR
jgi:hypothetical protein